VETHRLRVANRAGGPVEVSLDRGLTYRAIGRVTRPATANADGQTYAAAVPVGSVALAGAGRIWVRAGADGTRPRIFALLARGAPIAPWTIATDLLPGSAAFTTLSPPLGSRVFLQTPRGLRPLPAGYIPTTSDVILFIAATAGDTDTTAALSRKPPRAIIWENREGGAVTAIAGDGGERVIGTVRAPVRGVGRFAATAEVASGRIAEHHAHGLLVSTAGPAGGAAPAVGGFRIQVSDTDELESGDPTLLQIAPIQGAPSPLALPLPLDASTRVEMRVDDGPWMPLPRVTGAVLDAWGAGLARMGVLDLPDGPRGVTHFRLLPGGDPGARRLALESAVREARERSGSGVVIRERSASGDAAGGADSASVGAGRSASTPGSPQTPARALPLKGRLTVRANVTGRGITVVVFRLDGRVAKITNVAPYTWDWDTRDVANGDHTIEILGKDAEGNLINRRVTRVRVEN
jgi:hypothetical protein